MFMPVWAYTLAVADWREIAAPADGAYDPAWSPDGRWVAYAARTGRATTTGGDRRRAFQEDAALHCGRSDELLLQHARLASTVVEFEIAG